jgi:hypothetical protein
LNLNKPAKSTSIKAAKKTLIVTEDNDYQRLWPTLREEAVHRDLANLTGLAIIASHKARRDDKYTHTGNAFCDGFSVSLGCLPKKEAENLK